MGPIGLHCPIPLLYSLDNPEKIKDLAGFDPHI